MTPSREEALRPLQRAIDEARKAAEQAEQGIGPGRELALVKAKLEEAELWLTKLW